MPPTKKILFDSKNMALGLIFILLVTVAVLLLIRYAIL